MRSILIPAALLLLVNNAPAAVRSGGLPYLAGGMPVDLGAYVPGPPMPGSTEDRHDREVFRDGRPAPGSARWRQAVADADEAVPAMLRDFSQAAGVALSPERQPNLAHLLSRLREDTAATNDILKARYKRPRPFLRDTGPVCQDKKLLEISFDYPSGHTTWGTSVALALAELLPERATAILARGREYGNSRVVCGAHSISAVEAARQEAAGLVAILHGSAEFRADLILARNDLRGIQHHR